MELNAEQLTCLASPVRNELMTTVLSLGQASVTDLAQALGRTPESLYYHIEAMVRAGLLREAGRRPTRRKPEAVYEPVSNEIRLPDLRTHPELARLVRQSVAAGIRQTLRGYEAAMAVAERGETPGPVHVLRANVRLRPEDASRFRQLLDEAARFARQHEAEDGLRLGWMSVVYPHIAPNRQEEPGDDDSG